MSDEKSPNPIDELIDERSFICAGVPPKTEAAVQAVPDPITGKMLRRTMDPDQKWPRVVMRMRVVDDCIIDDFGVERNLRGCDSLLTLWLPEDDPDDWRREKLVKWACVLSGKEREEVFDLDVSTLVDLIEKHAEDRCHLVYLQTDYRGFLQVWLGPAWDDKLRSIPEKIDPSISKDVIDLREGESYKWLEGFRSHIAHEDIERMMSNMNVIEDSKGVREFVNDLEWQLSSGIINCIGLDLESDFGPIGAPIEWDARDGTIRLMQLAVPGEGVFVIDCWKTDPSPIIKLIKDSRIAVIIHYASFEQEWLSWGYGISELPKVICTWAIWSMAQRHLKVLDPSYEPIDNTLEAISEFFLGISMDKELGRGTWWGAESFNEEELGYAALDAAVLPILWQELDGIVSQLGFYGQYRQAIQRTLEKSVRIRSKSDNKNLEAQAEDLIDEVSSREGAAHVGRILVSLPLSWRQRARLKRSLMSKIAADSNNRGSVRVGNRHHGDEGVYIGRPTPLGNPYKRPDNGTTKEEVIEKYKKWLWRNMQASTPQKRAIEDLVNKVIRGEDVTLICSCAPKACHGDVVKAAIEWMIDESDKS